MTKAIGSFLFILFYLPFSLIQLAVLFFLPPSRIRRIYTHFDAKEEEGRVRSMSPFVREGETILDVGAGSGRFGKTIQEKLGVKVTGIDVCDYSDNTIPFFVYDGKKLPFPDKSFDVVFFAFVLHHTEDQTVLLREACRVAKRQIIIFEDTYLYWFERLATYWFDYHTNILQGWIKARKGYFKGEPFKMPMPLTFRSIEGWRRFFSSLPVEIASSEVRHVGHKPWQRVTFCLTPISI